MPGLSHRSLSITDEALSVITSIVQLCKARPPSTQKLPWWKTKPKEERRKEGVAVSSPVILKRTQVKGVTSWARTG